MHSDHRRAIIAHVAPFAAWILILSIMGEPAGWKYAVRTVCVLALFLVLRPWRWYPRLQVRHLPAAFGLGLAIFVVWVAGESRLSGSLPGLQEAYLRWGTMPPWAVPQWPATEPYSPAVAGWPLTLIRIAGSAFVIAIIEEFFWRGFLYRWLANPSFLEEDLLRPRWSIFIIVAIAFGLEHTRWLVGIVAGLGYGWFYLRTRDVWAVAIAHMITNLVLGVYVVITGRYAFWA